MRAIVLFAGVLMATPSGGAERQVFYTANYSDASSVQLSIVSDGLSKDGESDYEVAIGLTSTDASGAIKYDDRGTHHARIRCADPAYVRFGAHRYAIGSVGQGSAPDDWIEDLWKAFCAVPTS
jgi:hypothetical protein